MTQLADLAKPFSPAVIKSNPTGYGSYVGHPLYSQRLLLHLGAYDFEVVQILHGDVAEKAPDPDGKSKRAKEGSPALENAIVGVVMRLRVVIDGRTVTIEDAGDCEEPHNWPHDGARLKDATSDALKRCCARIGLGLHMYCGKEGVPYFLHSSLEKDDTKPEKPIEGQPYPAEKEPEF